MLDLHSHILPGLDDGMRSLEESRELARAALADGITLIAATPHVRDDFPTTPAQMEQALEAVRADLRAHSIDLEVVAGGEVAHDRIGSLDLADLRRFTINGTGRYLLVEFPYYGWPIGIERLVHTLAHDGLRAVLAHPERNAEVAANPTSLESAVENGALVQLTAASLDGRLGRTAHRTAIALLEHGLAHLIASDSHAPDLRAVGLSAAVDALRDGDLAHRLTVDVPTAIVEGRPAPAPARYRRSSRRGLRRFAVRSRTAGNNGAV